MNRKTHKFIFIGGHHRSGTSPMYHLLGTDPRISIFRDTGVIEDEGQFLQSVYLPDGEYGGSGAFALDGSARLTEESRLINRGRSELLNQWAPHWDLKRDFLAEKTPANIIRARFLQAVFENAYFIFLTRHPVAACLAVSKWNKAYVRNLFVNWANCHKWLMEDLPFLRNSTVIRYEELVEKRPSVNAQLAEVLGIEPNFDYGFLNGGLNEKYFKQWRNADIHLNVPSWKRGMKKLRNKAEIAFIERKYEDLINQFGYSFRDVY